MVHMNTIYYKHYYYQTFECIAVAIYLRVYL